MRRDPIFRVFVSSTFSDLVEERDALEAKVFSELRSYCQARGARFQAIDLRWGVSGEAGLDQQTMNICLKELARCQDLSPRPNFIVLLGDRYGWCPLPPQIDAQEFEELLACVPEGERSILVGEAEIPKWTDGDVIERTGWYRQDLNAKPPAYSLQARRVEHSDGMSIEDRKRLPEREAGNWASLEARMRTLLLDGVAACGWAADDPRRFKYEASATHQEIRAGALEVVDPEEHVFCYIRETAGLPSDGSAERFRDLHNDEVDQEAEARLDAIKERLSIVLPSENLHVYDATWDGEYVNYDLEKLCNDVREDLQGVIDRELEALHRQSSLERERDAHGEFGVERCVHFVGREDLLDQIAKYIASDDDCPMVVHGRSGTGKTALMAMAAKQASAKGAIAVRFIGATPGSSDLRSLLTELCREFGTEEVPTDMNDLVSSFRERLAPDAGGSSETENLVLFLDALDQLNPNDNARSLYWLPRTLAPGVKVILSVLEDGEPVGARESPFAMASQLWPESQAEVGALDGKSGEKLLSAWLTKYERTLQDPQRQAVLEAFAACPIPLYLRLLAEEARRWKSWQETPATLPVTVPDILEQLFVRLEQPEHHGATLVNRALGSIATSKNGLTEDELLDLLSGDGVVLDDFRARSPMSPVIERLPPVVWSRLFVDIEPYMTSRRADGTVTLDFYHRQVALAVAERYLKDDARAESHMRLADYFDGLDYWAESIDEQRKRAKRLPPTPRPANVRKVVELPYHRLEVAKLKGKNDPKSPHWDAVADLLTDWQFLEAKSEANPDFDFETDRANAEEAAKRSES